MERLKKPKEKKVRVNITLDESVYMNYGLYIENLSSFINKTLKNYIEIKEKEQNIVVGDNNVGYVKNYDHKKRTPIVDEVLNTDNQWWDS